MNLGNAALSIVLWTAGVIHFLLAAPIVLVLLLLLPTRIVFPVAQLVCRLELLVMGCRLKVVHREALRPGSAYLFVGNHESLFDVFAIGAALPSYAVGLEAAQHFRYPLWGWVTKAWGNIPLPEGRIKQGKNALAHAGEVLREGTHVVVLPEGHRTRTGRIGLLKQGAFYLAMATEADICPFVMQGLYEFKNTHSWRLHPRTLRVVFGKPIPAQTYVGSSTHELKDRVRTALEELDS